MPVSFLIPLGAFLPPTPTFPRSLPTPPPWRSRL